MSVCRAGSHIVYKSLVEREVAITSGRCMNLYEGFCTFVTWQHATTWKCMHEHRHTNVHTNISVALPSSLIPHQLHWDELTISDCYYFFFLTKKTEAWLSTLFEGIGYYIQTWNEIGPSY